MKDARGAGHQVSSSQTRSPDGRMDVDALFRAYAPFVAAFLARLGIPASDVDDRVQEVFIVAHRKGGYRPGEGHPRTWLGAIAVRVASTARRSQARRREDASDTLGGLSAAGATPIDALEHRRSLQRVQDALDSLDVEHRAAFVLYELEGESCDAIAASFGVPVGTIYSRLHHARRRFKQVYEAAEPTAESLLRPRILGGT